MVYVEQHFGRVGFKNLTKSEFAKDCKVLKSSLGVAATLGVNCWELM